MKVEIVLTTKELRDTVASLSERPEISRSSFSRWLRQWGFESPPYTIDHARLLASYSDFLVRGFTAETAHSLAIKYVEETQCQTH
jgi:hypothetical protein